MAVPNRNNPKIDDAYFPFWNITGRIGHKYRDGALEFAEDGSESAGIKPGIYQRRWNGYNNKKAKPKNKRKMYYIREKYYKPTNPRTPKQQANRQRIALAVRAWQSLSEQERDCWREIGRPILKRGVDLFISDFLKKLPPIPFETENEFAYDFAFDFGGNSEPDNGFAYDFAFDFGGNSEPAPIVNSKLPKKIPFELKV